MVDKDFVTNRLFRILPEESLLNFNDVSKNHSFHTGVALLEVALLEVALLERKIITPSAFEIQALNTLAILESSSLCQQYVGN